MPIAPNVISIILSVPSNIGALTCPMWATRNALHDNSPIADAKAEHNAAILLAPGAHRVGVATIRQHHRNSIRPFFRRDDIETQTAWLVPDHRGRQHRHATADPEPGTEQHAACLDLGLAQDDVGRGGPRATPSIQSGWAPRRMAAGDRSRTFARESSLPTIGASAMAPIRQISRQPE
jgi:hypothetical protein